MPEVEGRPVPFREAIDFFRQKVDLPTERWTDLWEGMHARAFVVAGAMEARLLEELRGAVDRSIAEGGTLARFRQEFDGIVERHGWPHRGSRGFRSRVIFETNLRTAYAAGRWQQIERQSSTFPYLRYVGTLDDRIRPQHRRWHGTILPWDHPWWRTHYPPNGWGCRCTVVQLSAAQMERRGWQVSTEPPPLDVQPRAVRIDGRLVTVPTPDGIDPGWAYNPGIAAWGQSQQALLLEAQGGFRPMQPLVPATLPDLPAVPAVAAPGRQVPRGDVEGLHAAWREALASRADADGAATLGDPAGARVRLTDAIPEHVAADPAARWNGREAFFPLIPELIEAPQEIRVGFVASVASGRVSMRRRYVRVFRLSEDRTIGLVADVQEGFLVGVTFFPGDRSDVETLRRGGVLLWRA